jgi:hypothetical protein
LSGLQHKNSLFSLKYSVPELVPLLSDYDEALEVGSFEMTRGCCATAVFTAELPSVVLAFYIVDDF